MTRIQWILATVVAVELVTSAYLAIRRLGPPTPPVPDLSFVDPLTAETLQARAADPRKAIDWSELGEAYLATGYFPEGEACLRRAVVLDPLDATLRFKHGFALERIGQLVESNAEYRHATESGGSRSADYWYYIGRNFLRMEQLISATDAFARAGELPAARYETAVLLARSGRTAEAEAEARKLATEFPTAQEPVSVLYRLAVLRNERETAARLADRLTNQRERLPTPFATENRWVYTVLHQLGRSRLERTAAADLQAGRYTIAERNLRSAQAAAWNPETADLLAEAVFRQGRPAEAVELFSESLARNGPSFGLLWRLGESFEATGRADDALATWLRADEITTGPWGKEMWQAMAKEYARRGDESRAKMYRIRSALAAGMEAVQAGQPGSAVEPLKAAIDLDPRLAHAWYYLGEAARADGQTTEARTAYRKCLEINTDHGRAARAMNLLGR